MKKLWIVICFAVVALIALGWFLGASLLQRAEAVQPTPTPSQAQGIDVTLLQKRWGKVFVPADATARASAKITQEQALAAAYQVTPGLKTATGVAYNLGYLADPGLIEAAKEGEKVDPNMAYGGLVWILAFQGIQSVSAGPVEGPHGVSNELNVVVNATTGEELYQFTYR